MRYTSSTLIVLATMSIGEAMAGPAHAHHHRHLHEKRAPVDWNALDWNDMGIDFSSIAAAALASKTAAPVAAEVQPTTFATAAAPVVATPTTSVAATASSATSSGSSGLWRGIVGAANGRTSFGAAVPNVGDGVDAMGNYGSPYGANMMIVDNPLDYDFTVTYCNSGDDDLSMVVWNKAGIDGQANSGFALASTQPALTFVNGPADCTHVAFQDWSIIGSVVASDASLDSAIGGFTSAWAEIKLTVEQGSGYDVSMIGASNKDDCSISIAAMGSTCSSACQGAQKTSMWINDVVTIAAADGADTDGSCYVPGNSAHLTITQSE